jgi:ABC-2 type transport system permease protein
MSIGRGLAWREMARQLTSPATWLIVGVFALLAGLAFVNNLNAFLDASIDALSAPPPRPINVNQLMIRPFVVQVWIAALLVLPLVTARVRATRFAMAQFAGVLAVYGVMLAASLALVALLFFFGALEWAPIVSGYLGLLLAGAAFIGAALFISSLATTAVPAAIATFAISLALMAATWLAQSGAPAARPAFRPLAIGLALDDFAKGVIDAGHVVTCVTIAALALFLTHTLQPDRRGY